MGPIHHRPNNMYFSDEISKPVESEIKEKVCDQCNGHGTPYADVRRFGTMIYTSAYPVDPIKCTKCGGSGRIKYAIYKPSMPSIKKVVPVSQYSAGNISLKKITIYSALALFAKVVNDRAEGKVYGRN